MSVLEQLRPPGGWGSYDPTAPVNAAEPAITAPRAGSEPAATDPTLPVGWSNWRLTPEQQVMVTDNTGLIHHVLRSWYSHLLTDDDAWQDGYIGLARATVDYDPDRARFSTYATQWIRAAIQKGIETRHGANWRAARRAGHAYHEPRSLDQLLTPHDDDHTTIEVPDDRPGPEQHTDNSTLLAVTTEALEAAVCDDLDRDIVTRLAAITAGHQPEPRQTIAARHGVSTDTLRRREIQIKAAAQRALLAAGMRSTGVPRITPRGQVPHGSRSRYQTGCHCDDCRAAAAAYHRRRRAS